MLVALMILLGIIFLTTGKIKSTIFDIEKKEIIIRKRTISCHCRTVTKYDMVDLFDVRAVHRGINSRQYNNTHYSIILDFVVGPKKKENKFDDAGDTDDENSYLTSDAE